MRYESTMGVITTWMHSAGRFWATAVTDNTVTPLPVCSLAFSGVGGICENESSCKMTNYHINVVDNQYRTAGINSKRGGWHGSAIKTAYSVLVYFNSVSGWHQLLPNSDTRR